ncbi:MAG: S8 family serine peptidase [Nitrospirota bacterium]|nr:S8 family serine peptidase [Nitrospirota bacterium]
MVTKTGKTAKVKVFIAVCSLFVAGQALESHAASPFVQDELLVQHRAGVASAKMEEVIRGHGASTVGEIPQIRVKRIKVPAGAMDKVKAALEKNPFVSFAEPNYVRGLTATPNDAQYPSQWHLANISAPSGWDLSTGSTSYPIAIIDTGVDPAHPDLAGKLVPGWNFVTRTNDTRDVYGHGTKVAGSAAAISNNASGVAGVAWNNPIMPLVVSDSTGSAWDADIASAMIYAADRGVKVINISYGGPGSSTTLQSAADYAWSKGAIIFASAGNYGSNTPNYPAACNHVVAVSATTSSNTLASWSSFGDWLDVAAPGASILTTANGGSYAYVSGTSFSSPITSGLAALVVSVNPTLKNSDVEAIIKNNADDLGAAGFDAQFGFGKINAYYTLLAAKAAAPVIDTTAPVVSIVSPTNSSAVSRGVAVTVSANDDNGVTRVDLYVDGTLYATGLTGPFSFFWDSASVSDGSHDLVAVAYDAAGNVGQSDKVTVMVSNPVDTTAPVVAITSPANGDSIGSRATIQVAATDDTGVSRIDLYIDNALKCTSSGSTLSCNWNTRKEKAGAHSIAAKAFDAAGNVATTSITVFK